MSIRENNTRLLLANAILGAIKETVDQMRAEQVQELLKMYEESGTKSFSVILPDGTKVGQIALPESKPKFEITDEVKFVEWYEKVNPLGVEEVVIPAQPERRFKRPKKASVDAFMKGLKGEPSGIAVDENGEIVEGVTYTPSATRRSLTITYEGKGAGRKAILDAWRYGDLKGITDPGMLPEIGDGSDG